MQASAADSVYYIYLTRGIHSVVFAVYETYTVNMTCTEQIIRTSWSATLLTGRRPRARHPNRNRVSASRHDDGVFVGERYFCFRE